jgi:hypothetical protein
MGPGTESNCGRNEFFNSLLEQFKQVRFETNRLNIDQGAKLNASLNAIIAEGTGALAAVWRSLGKIQENYDARLWHAACDGNVYLLRGSWAEKAGLVQPDKNGFVDEIVAPAGATQPKPGEPDQPGMGIYCRCYFQYLYNLDA